jgi:hypothetical protein
VEWVIWLLRGNESVRVLIQCPGRSAIGREEQRKNSCSDHGLANYLLASECLGLLDKQ